MILGLDISTACTGWALMEKETKVIYACGKIDFSIKDSFQQKVGKLYHGLIPIFEMGEQIEKVGIEDQFFFKNARTVKILARFSGVACTIAYLYNSSVIFLPPMTIKKIFTGKGNAKKEETRAKVLEMYHVDLDNDNITDAISVAYAICSKE